LFLRKAAGCRFNELNSIMYKLFYFFSLLFLFSIPTAQAQISVDGVIVYLSANKPPVKNITVSNSSPNAMLANVTAVKVENPGTKDEKRVPTDEIIISPKRFSVPGKGERTVRLLLKTPPTNTERVFRVAFTPEAAEETEEAKPKSSHINILTGVGILVFAEPIEPTPALVWERSNNKLRLTNSGNINVVVDRLKACDPDKNNCKDYDGKRLYAGNSLVLDVQNGKVLSLRKKERQTFSTVEIE